MLVKYEFLKILRKKSTLIIMAVSLILTAFLFGLPIIQFQTYNQEGVMKGFEGIEYQKTQRLRKISPAAQTGRIALPIVFSRSCFPDACWYPACAATGRGGVC